jgi:hypothetical protein
VRDSNGKLNTDFDLKVFLDEQLAAKAKLLEEHPERFTMVQARYERDMKKCHTQDDRMFVSHNLMIESLKVLNNRILELQGSI